MFFSHSELAVDFGLADPYGKIKLHSSSDREIFGLHHSFHEQNIFLSHNKVLKMDQQAVWLQINHLVTTSNVMTATSHMTASIPVVPWAHLHQRPLPVFPSEDLEWLQGIFGQPGTSFNQGETYSVVVEIPDPSLKGVFCGLALSH